MTSDKKNISLLADIFIKKGLSNIIISPGSRNAPIILSFANREEIVAFSIVDERSAAFFALGMSLQTGKTTAIACTSGSAVLNYASAISEAFYQKVPLLIITADRPLHLVDVGDGQTIRQHKIFENFVKESYQLPENIDITDDFRTAERIINEAINNCTFPQPGPVHINIPFDEPIYNTTNDNISGNITPPVDINVSFRTSDYERIIRCVNSFDKVMIIGGQNVPNIELNILLQKLSKKNNIVILSETTTNVCSDDFIDTIDNLISTISEKDAANFIPDVVISFGGQVVSKMVKKFLRKNKPQFHWHISQSGEKMNTYFCLKKALKCSETDFFTYLNDNIEPSESNYSTIWKQHKVIINEKKELYLENVEFSDLKVFKHILAHFPSDSNLHLGNSTPVRYSQLFGSKPSIIYNSNRGVSGIDGHLSTAVGYSYFSEKLNVLITGDLGFLYDSNGLMNHYLKPNLKIIVINNSGGGIFRFIPGPDTTPNLEDFFEVRHNWNAEYICKSYGVTYLKANDIESLQYALPNLFEKSNEITLLEIFTPPVTNGDVLRDYFKFIKT
jgi:2-succinyl-5-enolpyruvyl-6-hydroxy-3-cyclohexene-1-carboxylate synthase